jgi:hypothetical protein
MLLASIKKVLQSFGPSVAMSERVGRRPDWRHFEARLGLHWFVATAKTDPMTHRSVVEFAELRVDTPVGVSHEGSADTICGAVNFLLRELRVCQDRESFTPQIDGRHRVFVEMFRRVSATRTVDLRVPDRNGIVLAYVRGELSAGEFTDWVKDEVGVW